MSAWEEAVAKILADPSVSFWLKKAVHGLMERDPLDAQRDAELLAKLMKARADYVLRGK